MKYKYHGCKITTVTFLMCSHRIIGDIFFRNTDYYDYYKILQYH